MRIWRLGTKTGAVRARSRALASLSALGLATGVLAMGTAPASASGPYTVTDTIGVGAGPSAVAADPATDTVYVTNSAAGTVSVINGLTNTVTATIRVGGDPRGVAVDPATDTIYVTSYQDGTVSVIDGSTSTVTATIELGGNPWAVAVDPATDTVYVANSADNTVSVISGPASAPLAMTTAALPAATVGTPYTATLGATGGTAPYRFSLAAGSLPPGLTLNPATGAISGSPVLPGTADFTAQVSDTASPATTATRPLSITTGGCTRTITGTHHGPLTIRKGVTCITAATFRGSLTITRGATVAISGSHISGPFRSNQAETLSVCSTRITGPVSVTASTGYVLVGNGSPACGASTIRGRVTLTSNADGLELAGNTIFGAVRLTGNSGPGHDTGTAGLEVEANHIRGSLACWRNTPAPTDGSQPNTVTGHAAGQCVRLAQEITLPTRLPPDRRGPARPAAA